MDARRSILPRPKRSRSGSTFIEAIIGMAIVGVALLGLAQLFLLSISNNTRGGEISQATFLAQQRIDYLRSLTAAELAEFPSVGRAESVDEPLDMNSDGTLDFRRVTVVQASGYSYAVKVLIFPASESGASRDSLLLDPSGHKSRISVSTIISR